MIGLSNGREVLILIIQNQPMKLFFVVKELKTHPLLMINNVHVKRVRFHKCVPFHKHHGQTQNLLLMNILISCWANLIKL